MNLKVILNSLDMTCLSCGVGTRASLNDSGLVVCDNCLSENITHRSTGEPFQPIFGGPARTYKVNKYGPEIRCRRHQERRWPKIRERRKSNGN